MEDKRNIIITTLISFFLFFIIIFLMYVIYVFAYYNKKQEEIYLEYYNNNKYDYIYNNLDVSKELDKIKFNKVISIMYDKKYLLSIYNKYYNNSNIYENENTFIDSFYYGNIKINLDSITFNSFGKTNLFNRRKLYYDKINLTSNTGIKSILGIVDDIEFILEQGSVLSIDNGDYICYESPCKVDKMFGGLHIINYTSNGFNYFGIINVNDDNLSIDITGIDNLVSYK